MISVNPKMDAVGGKDCIPNPNRQNQKAALEALKKQNGQAADIKG